MKIKLNNIFKIKKQKKENKKTKEVLLNKRNTRIKKIHTMNNINDKDKEENFEYRYRQFKVYDNGLNDGKNEIDISKKHVRKGANFNNEEDLINDAYKENSEHKRIRKFSRSYMVLFSLMIGLAIVSVTFNLKRNNDLNDEDYAVFNSTDKINQSSTSEDNTDLQDNNTSNKDTNEIITENEAKAVVAKNEETKKESTPKVVIEPLSFTKPLDGEIMKVYSIDKVIYSKTLELWKTHDGIDIKADLGSVVKSIEKGTIEKVYNDSFYGNTIVIDHGQGYKSSYSNLSDDILVKPKQSIKKGTKLGYIGDSAIGEIKDDPHLHFMLFLNNENIDPTSIFK